jgi:hypothetical protein
MNLARPAAAWVLLMSTVPAVAQSGRLDQQGWVQLGAFRPSIDSTVQYNNPSSGLAGTELDLESDLGLAKRKTLPSLLIGARIADRWRVEFEHFALKRSGTETLDVAINVDDTTFSASAQVDTDFSSKVYRLSGGYSFYKSPEAEAGLSLGVHVTDFRLALEGIGSVNGGPASVRSERRDKTVPLPTLGLYGTWAFAPSWEAGGRLDVLSLKVRDYKGTLLNAQANVFYRVTPNVALGLGYRHDDYRLKAERSDWTGKVEYRFSGPQVVLDAGF